MIDLDGAIVGEEEEEENGNWWLRESVTILLGNLLDA